MDDLYGTFVARVGRCPARCGRDSARSRDASHHESSPSLWNVVRRHLERFRKSAQKSTLCGSRLSPKGCLGRFTLIVCWGEWLQTARHASDGGMRPSLMARPETLINAVRRDAAALRTPRAVATIRHWQHCVRQGPPEEARMARRFSKRWRTPCLPSTTDTHEPLESRRPTHIATTPGPHASARPPETRRRLVQTRRPTCRHRYAYDGCPAVFLSTRGALTPEGNATTSLDQVP